MLVHAHSIVLIVPVHAAVDVWGGDRGAVIYDAVIVMVYEGGTRGTAHRRVTPRELLQSGGRAYLTAYCHVDRIEKTYRLDHIWEFWIEYRVMTPRFVVGVNCNSRSFGIQISRWTQSDQAIC